MKNIISASRRTDIPAFYSDWFLQRLKEGHVFVKNPYGGQIYRVSLKSDDIHCIVFWSKNYSPLISRIEEIESFTNKLFFHFTITGIPKAIEQNTPPLEESVNDFIYLSSRYSPAHLVWRFDPICITDKLPFAFYEEMFAACIDKLKGHCNKCYISFAQKYKKAIANFEKYSNHRLVDVDTAIQREYAAGLGRIAEKNGITLYACCSDHLLSESVHKGSCINSAELARLFHDPHISSPHSPTRKGCACTKSIDIGAYDTCPHGCLYCYANSDKEKSGTALENMEMEWNGLGFHVDKDHVKEKSFQSSLF